MNKRRRVGRGPVPLKILNRYAVQDTAYTYQRYQTDQQKRYEQRLRDWGLDYEAKQERE